jgi:uncharacterized membrane protein
MAKANKRLKGKNDEGAFEHIESFDDSLLPAEELSKLKTADPGLIQLIAQQLIKEQASRHEFTRTKLSFVGRDQEQSFKIDVITICCAFILMIAGMLLSYTLLKNNDTLVGSIFGGTTLLLSAKAFLGFRENA